MYDVTRCVKVCWGIKACDAGRSVAFFAVGILRQNCDSLACGCAEVDSCNDLDDDPMAVTSDAVVLSIVFDEVKESDGENWSLVFEPRPICDIEGVVDERGSVEALGSGRAVNSELFDPFVCDARTPDAGMASVMVGGC